uniref:Odorant receptor n=1 Tax=Aphidius gifuensis TaxID=684658 RepID=A0A3Q9ELF6_APHGI|nr:odorant receptor [Aphidius gifuensis]
MENKTEVDFFDNENWYLTKYLLSIFGGWPFQQASIGRTIRRSILIFLWTSTFLPLLFKLFNNFGNIELVLICLSQLFLHIMTLTYTVYSILNSDKEKILLNKIKKQFEYKLSNNDRKFVEYYTYYNRKIIYGYTISFYIVVLAGLTLVTVPVLLNNLFPSNVSSTPTYIFEVDYLFFDYLDYENLIFLNAWMSILCQTTILIAFDCLYSQLTYFISSWFYVIGNRMKYLTNNSKEINKKQQYDLFNKYIEEHERVLKFASDVQSIYSYPLFILICIQMLTISVTGCNIMSESINYADLLRYVCYIMVQFIHLFFLCWHGQVLIDNSENLSKIICQMNWYVLPNNIKKLLILIIMRSSYPCTLVAGKFLVMSFESFAQVYNIFKYLFKTLIIIQ